MPRRKPKKSQARKRLIPKVDLRRRGSNWLQRLARHGIKTQPDSN